MRGHQKRIGILNLYIIYVAVRDSQHHREQVLGVCLYRPVKTKKEGRKKKKRTVGTTKVSRFCTYLTWNLSRLTSSINATCSIQVLLKRSTTSPLGSVCQPLKAHPHPPKVHTVWKSGRVLSTTELCLLWITNGQYGFFFKRFYWPATIGAINGNIVTHS